VLLDAVPAGDPLGRLVDLADSANARLAEAPLAFSHDV